MNSEPEKKSIGRKIWSIISTVLIVLIVIIAILLVGARIAGLNVYTIISGSMEPTYNVGDLIYVKEVSPSEVQVGDPITFVLNEDLVVATHRVIEIDEENQHFYTKGDNNQVADVAPVHFNNLIGKPVFKIPLLGYVSNWIQNPPGTYIAIAVIVILLGLVFIPDLFMKARDEEKEMEKAEKEKEDKEKEEPKPEIEKKEEEIEKKEENPEEKKTEEKSYEEMVEEIKNLKAQLKEATASQSDETPEVKPEKEPDGEVREEK